jgi:FdhE protein
MAASLEGSPPLHGRFEDDAPVVVPLALEVAAFVERAGPEPLRLEAHQRRVEEPLVLTTRLGHAWTEGAIPYLPRAMLRPYVEVLCRSQRSPDRPRPEGRCPSCGGGPWIAVRRPEPESDAARRLLGCSLCGGEWPFPRVRCPCCGEEKPEKLPLFESDRYPGARIDACETCKRYVKSIDLTRDARPIPEVDDLVSLSLDLWAVEEGYTRIEPGLAGV